MKRMSYTRWILAFIALAAASSFAEYAFNFDDLYMLAVGAGYHF